jgi:hypothetical protein
LSLVKIVFNFREFTKNIGNLVFAKVPYTFVRSLNLKSFFALGEGTPLRLFLDSVRLHNWPEEPQWHCFSFQFPVGASESIPTNAPVGRSVHYWMVAFFHPPPDPAALTHGVLTSPSPSES